ncbi:hypothetical protein RHO13_04795 [Orbus wheelerorum]|uniref:hypothetical protein n=1 Tax=Orbus wheelerorum TaxID=3074111 RepID=UPI00370DC373
MKRNLLYREIVKGLDWKLDTSNHSQSDYKKLPKKPRAYLLIACTGNNGITENEILTVCRLSSGRNYCSELERKLNITLKRVDESNTDGIGSHFRYYLASKEDTQKVINLILSYQPCLLSDWDITRILDQYPNKVA